MLDRIRKLLTQAEDDAVTTAEAEAFTAKAAELMARYGIDRAVLADSQPGTDQPADRIITIPNPWAAVHAHLLCGGYRDGHVKGTQTDLEASRLTRKRRPRLHWRPGTTATSPNHSPGAATRR